MMQYAADSVEGYAKIKKNKELVTRAQLELNRAREERSVKLEHVKGHSFHKWNDRADLLAKRGTEGKFARAGRWTTWAQYTHPLGPYQNERDKAIELDKQCRAALERLKTGEEGLDAGQALWDEVNLDEEPFVAPEESDSFGFGFGLDDPE